MHPRAVHGDLGVETVHAIEGATVAFDGNEEVSIAWRNVTVVDDLTAAGFTQVRIRTGWKPLARVGGHRLPRRIELPYPPLVGNGIMAAGRA